MNTLRASDFVVRPADLGECRRFIEAFHYARGASNTAVFTFGLFHVAAPTLLAGGTWWLPPTKVAAQSVNPARWQRVLGLSRMAVAPRPLVGRNACSFMLGQAVRAIRRDGRFVSLVTYADESQGHEGLVYRASGWEYVGRMGPYPRWVDPTTGRQVAVKATTSRTVAQMLALGYQRDGSFHKHKFVKHLS